MFHELIHSALRSIKAVEGRLRDALGEDFFGVKIKVNLLWSIGLYKRLIYCFRFPNYLLRVLAFLVIFTGYPKCNVLITEFGLKKSGKSLQSIFLGKQFVK